MIYDKLYKRATDGSIQVWWMEREDDKYRTHTGQLDGKIVTTEWRTATPKNVGKANESSAEAQAELEVQADYKKKLKLRYVKSVNDVDGDFYFAPMLAKKYEDYPINWLKDNVFAQPKLDGFRCVVNSEGAFTRKG